MKRILTIIITLCILSGCTYIESLSLSTSVTTTALPEQSSTTLPICTLPPPPADPLETRLSNMSTEEKVGQLFLARCPDIKAVEDIQTYHLGGYILFGRDFENKTPSTVKSTIASYQEASLIPMLIAVDEEGGTVNRVSLYPAFRSAPFSSSRYLYQQGDVDIDAQTVE